MTSHKVLCIILALLVSCDTAADASQTIHPMDTLEGITFTSGDPQVVSEGPGGERVILIEGRKSGGATGRVDASFGAFVDLGDLDLHAYDVLKLDVNAARGTVVLLSLEHFPEPGMQARWYFLDGMRGPTGWRTIVVDLQLPEEIRRSEGSTGSRLRLTGHVRDSGRAMQGEDRRILLGEIRALDKAVDVDWDQREFSIDHGEDLVYTYPLTVTNTHTEAITASLNLKPFRVARARADVTPAKVALEPGESTVVQARITLPDARDFQPLYAERFEVWARAEGMPDSDVTITRSSDVIHLPVLVPLPEAALRFPIFPTPDQLPAPVLRFDQNRAYTRATARPTSELIAYARENGIYNYRDPLDNAAFRSALVSAAYLYRLTDDEQYLAIARELINALPGIWEEQLRRYEEQVRHKLISSGVIVRSRRDWHYTLSLGWRLAGTQRSPYYYGQSGNGAGGGMSAIFHAFDMVAPALTAAERKTFIHEFAVPAGIRCRNHYVGDGNQQSTANAAALYAGLISRNWPLVAFATSSEHGYGSIIEWTHTDDGMHIRDGYQTYSLRPILFNAELLYQVGLVPYETYLSRFESAVYWRGARPFQDMYFWNFVANNRLTEPSELVAPTGLVATEGGSVTSLRWSDESPNEAWFLIERADGDTGEFELIGRSPQGWSAYQDPCPEPGNTYRYRVRAMNYSVGESRSSNVVTARCG